MTWFLSRMLVVPPVVAVAPPLGPVIACALRCFNSRIARRPDILGCALRLHNLRSQTKRCVVSDVAVHYPRSWVVELEGYNDKAFVWQQDYIAPGWIIGIECDVVREAFHSSILLQNDKVVTMQVYLENMSVRLRKNDLKHTCSPDVVRYRS